MVCLAPTINSTTTTSTTNSASLSVSCYHGRPRLSVYRRDSFPRVKVSGLMIILDASSCVPRGSRSISFTTEKGGDDDEDEDEDEYESSLDRLSTFEAAVKLFNEREYYACHDLLESLWFDSYDPLRTLFHALLQSAVAFYHLFNHNHKGAMMEMGEGLCKLRKLNLEEGPFYEFEQQISTVLNFIYHTQLELAACNEDVCLTIEQTERSYQLLEGYGGGKPLYFLEQNNDGHQNDISYYIVFDPHTSYGASNLPSTRVKLPVLEATRKHIIPCENY